MPNIAGTFWTIDDGDFYVSTIGNDISGDGSPQNPYLTIAKAFDEASNGDKIVIGPNEYVLYNSTGADPSGAYLPCRVATVNNVGLTGALLIDDVNIQGGDRVLVWQQASQAENGIYSFDGSNWQRAEDFNHINDIIPGKLIPILEGAAHGNSIFHLSSSGSITLNSSPLTFEKVNGGSSWGAISGTLSDQTDLAVSLGEKADKADVLALDNTSVFNPTGDYHPATRKYVQDQISGINSFISISTPKGTIDASTNPGYPAGSQGDYYYISASGTVGGDAVEVGDKIQCIADTAGGIASDWIIFEGAFDKATQAEAENATDDEKYLTPAKGLAGWKHWVGSQTISGLVTSNQNIVAAINEAATQGGVSVTNEGDNRVITSTGNGTGQAESNLQFDGTGLQIGPDSGSNSVVSSNVIQLNSLETAEGNSIEGIGHTGASDPGLVISGRLQGSETGGRAAIEMVAAAGTGPVISRPLFGFMNQNTSIFEIAANGNWDFQGNRLMNLMSPVDDNDAATKAYVHSAISLGNHQIVIGTGTGISGSSDLTFESNILKVTGAANSQLTIGDEGIRYLDVSGGDANSFYLNAAIDQDQGPSPAMVFRSFRAQGPNAISARPLFSWFNHDIVVAQIEANGHWNFQSNHIHGIQVAEIGDLVAGGNGVASRTITTKTGNLILDSASGQIEIGNARISSSYISANSSDEIYYGAGTSTTGGGGISTFGSDNSNNGGGVDIKLRSSGLFRLYRGNTVLSSVNNSGDWDFGGNSLTNVSDPVNDQDVATKAYVDSSDDKLLNLEDSDTNIVNSSSGTGYFQWEDVRISGNGITSPGGPLELEGLTLEDKLLSASGNTGSLSLAGGNGGQDAMIKLFGNSSTSNIDVILGDRSTSQLNFLHSQNSQTVLTTMDNSGNWDFKGNQLTNIGNPVNPQDAVTLDYLGLNTASLSADQTFTGSNVFMNNAANAIARLQIANDVNDALFLETWGSATTPQLYGGTVPVAGLSRIVTTNSSAGLAIEGGVGQNLYLAADETLGLTISGTEITASLPLNMGGNDVSNLGSLAVDDLTLNDNGISSSSGDLVLSSDTGIVSANNKTLGDISTLWISEGGVRTALSLYASTNQAEIATIANFDLKLSAGGLTAATIDSSDQSWNFDGNKLTNLANPINNQDAATKAYVDGIDKGDSWSDPIDSNITVGAHATYDLGTSGSRLGHLYSDKATIANFSFDGFRFNSGTSLYIEGNYINSEPEHAGVHINGLKISVNSGVNDSIILGSQIDSDKIVIGPSSSVSYGWSARVIIGDSGVPSGTHDYTLHVAGNTQFSGVAESRNGFYNQIDGAFNASPLRLYSNFAMPTYASGAESLQIISNMSGGEIAKIAFLTGSSLGNGEMAFYTATGSTLTERAVLLESGNWNFHSNKLTNIADPTDAQDVATKAYVDANASGLANLMDSGSDVTNSASGTGHFQWGKIRLDGAVLRTVGSGFQIISELDLVHIGANDITISQASSNENHTQINLEGGNGGIFPYKIGSANPLYSNGAFQHIRNGGHEIGLTRIFEISDYSSTNHPVESIEYKNVSGGGELDSTKRFFLQRVYNGAQEIFALKTDGSRDYKGNRLTSVADPVNDQDVATKAYVDNNGGFAISNPVSNGLITSDGSSGAEAESNLTYDGSNILTSQSSSNVNRLARIHTSTSSPTGGSAVMFHAQNTNSAASGGFFAITADSTTDNPANVIGATTSAGFGLNNRPVVGFYNGTASGTKLATLDHDGGWDMGSANGGSQGAGTVNAKGLFIEGKSLESGEYTPTVATTNPSHVSATIGETHYQKIGDIVHVNGRITSLQATSQISECVVMISLPISTNFISSSELHGVISGASNTDQITGYLQSNSTDNTARLNIKLGAANISAYAGSVGFSFMYTLS